MGVIHVCRNCTVFINSFVNMCVRKTNCFLPNKKKKFVKVDNRGLYVYIGCF